VEASAIGQALLAVGDQWTLLILQRAFLKHTRRFADWRDDIKISESVLAARLKEMVANDLLKPVPYRNGRMRTEYHLTDKAIELWPMLVSIWSWERTWVQRGHPLPELVHKECGERTDVELGCAECGKAPITARDVETTREGTFAQVSAPRLHRRITRQHDPLSYLPATMEILGDRWSTVLLAAAFLGHRRFSEFEAQLGLAPSILSDRLKRFAELGVLRQEAEYQLTGKGLAFFGVFAFLTGWAQRWYAGADITISHCERGFSPFLRCATCLHPVTRAELTWEFWQFQ
jgi:DNA-binding HxlR family transcriptional regulator